ncbi:MAG: leucine-rich repeat protein [Bacteroidales bacterium]|nr:leucine-rich repeat protein [Bacteroidales bacterium]
MKYKLNLSLMALIGSFLCWLVPSSAWALTSEEDLTVLATGSCGVSLTYTIYSDFSMVISGTGEMKDYVDDELHIDADYFQKITSVVIEDGVSSIGQFAFYDFIRMASLSIPNSVTKIGNAAFYNCVRLASLDLPSNLTEIGNGAFYGCDALTSIEIPSGVNIISPVLFFNCTGLTSVTIPDGVTEIGNAAFECCSSLATITIPSTVTSIGDAAFEWCTSLTSITVEIDIPLEISAATFNNVDKAACTLYVPAGSKSAYESAEVWSEFQNIEEIPGDYVIGDANGDGEVLIGDVIAILNYIVGVTSDNFNEKAADANGDGEILIGDVIAVLNIIVGQ